MNSFFVHGPIAWAGLALLSIPIIIHLINRRRFLRIDWAAMDFLLDALKRNRRRLRIEQLILLLLRMALMLLAAFVLARPVLSDKGLAWMASMLRSEDRILLLDDSLSMARKEAGRTAFARASDAAAGQVRKMAERGGGDRLTLVRGSRHRSPMVRGVFVDRQRALGLVQTLGSLKPTDTRLPLAAGLESILEDSARSGSEGAARPRQISIFTDLRATDWMASGGGPDEAVHDALLKATGNEDVPTRVIVLDVGGDDGDNVAITSVAIEGGKAITGIPVELRVTLRNFGRTAARGLGLRVRFAPAPVVSGQDALFAASPGPPVADLEAGASATYTVSCTFRATGDYGVLVDLTGAPDAVPQDNTYPLVVDVLSGTKVLVISGEPSSESFQGESDFLVRALAPAGDVASGIHPEVVTEENVPKAGLDKYAAIFALNVHSFPEDFVPLLRRYVEEGGSLVVFLGDQVDTALANRQLGSPPPAEGKTDGGASPDLKHGSLLPARLGEVLAVADHPLGFRLVPDHPYFRPLRDVAAMTSQVHFQAYVELEPLAASQVLARFTDAGGSPAIVEHASGEGRVILFASTADMEWNDWARNPSYLLVLQGLLAAVVKARSAGEEPVAGAPLTVPIDIAAYEQTALLREPGYPAKVQHHITAVPRPAADGDREAASSLFRFVLENTSQAGLYALQLKTKSGEPAWREIALRRDPRESNLRRIPAGRLRELYPDVDLTIVTDPSSFSQLGRGGFEASDLLLWGFLALLFVEAFLARFFAHHPSAPARPREGGGS